MPHSQPLAISVTEAAELLSLSSVTIRRMIRRGQLPALHVGRSVRIPVAAVEQLVAAAGAWTLPDSDGAALQDSS